MKAITVEPGKAGSARLEDVQEPDARNGSVLVEAVATGACGTDAEIADGEYGWAPSDKPRLVLGHESLGCVLDPGPGSGLKLGDLVVGIVRRPDPVPCPNCAVGFEPDVVLTCTGAGVVIAETLSVIAASGVVCLTGVGQGGTIPKIATAGVLAFTAVLNTSKVIGSVDANRRHWYKAAEALARADRSWLGRLIARRERPETFPQALAGNSEDIKVIIQIADVSGTSR